MVMLFVIQLPSFAFDQYESMKVGETKTFYFPSEVTSKASSMYSYSCTSDYINNVEVVSYTNSSVTVKAIAYTKYTVNIRFDYWWTENGYSKTDTHKVHIDLSDSDGQVTPIGGDYNPNNYFWDKGSWGTVTIEAGETDFFYCQFKNSESDPNVKSIVWSSYGQIGYEILSQNSTSCIIKGNYECNGQKLWCLMKYGSTSYRAYYTINVKESSKEKLTLSAEPNGGTVENGTIVYLTASQPSSDIYYTTDGSTPTQSSKKYSYSGIPIYNSCTLKAVAYKSGYNNSSVMTWIFTVKESDENAIVINSTNFPDDNFRAYLLSQDYGKDGKLTESEIKEITKIDVSNMGINSLKGIGYFKKLETLYCHENLLMSLDVTNNLEMRFVQCNNNQLTLCNVSKNTKLTSLKCDYNNLTTLDVSKNTSLEYLNCRGNQLTSLDVTENTMLSYLNCYRNQLTSLVLTKNPMLSSLNCSNNKLTSLDVSKQTNLYELDCSKNQIRDRAMDNLIMSLPMTTNGKFYVIEYPNEENICTKQQVANAKAKGWTPMFHKDGRVAEYEGSDEATAINDAKSQPDVIDGAAIYSLSGQRLAAPRKGLNIIGGKKVVMK